MKTGRLRRGRLVSAVQRDSRSIYVVVPLSPCVNLIRDAAVAQRNGASAARHESPRRKVSNSFASFALAAEEVVYGSIVSPLLWTGHTQRRSNSVCPDYWRGRQQGRS